METGEIQKGMPHDQMMKLFEDVSFREKVHKVIDGLKQPKDSGAYKYATFQLVRLWAVVAAIVVPCTGMALIMAFATMKPPPPRSVPVQIIEPEAVEDLEEIEELVEEPLKPPEPIEMDFTPDVTIADAPVEVAPPTDFSPQPAEFDSVAIVKSPVIMKGIYGSRSPGARGKALAQYGALPGGVTECAVLRALRWLKKNQESDGSWKKNKAAMTGLALLSFLAHGETPASEEFGPTVEKAIRWLVDHQGRGGGWPRRYQHAIAAYAICEAYALTKVPILKETAERATDIIIKGQNASGGFDYGLNRTQRDDTSVMGWCAQALKAASMADLEVEGLDQSMELAVKGFQKNAHPSGGFGYCGPGAGGLTGVGVLCMQLLGAAREPEARKGLMALENASFNWEGGGKFNKNYYWYYITQAKFHAGAETWNRWNKMFAPVLVKNQTVIRNAIMGPKGKMVDIGYWEMDKALSGHTDGVVMNTALSVLQLQVYYRYLPTFRSPRQIKIQEEIASDDDDIDIEIEM